MQMALQPVLGNGKGSPQHGARNDPSPAQGLHHKPCRKQGRRTTTAKSRVQMGLTSNN